jgi:hypothetical protein
MNDATLDYLAAAQRAEREALEALVEQAPPLIASLHEEIFRLEHPYTWRLRKWKAKRSS